MYRLTVKGIVQGVGFRPFVYRLAKSMGLKGYVKNTGDGTVEIIIDSRVDEFVERLRKEKPPIAVVESVRVEEVDLKPPEDFTIEKSGGSRKELSLPPPDVATCDACLNELFNPKDRRYLYSFISCTDCGPRFSVAVRLPYDRENTTFVDFPLCSECSKEYWDVEDRRYYAQSIACRQCGPDYELVLGNRIIRGLDGIIRAAELIDSGKIIAIKGLGGYHIACITDDEVVWNLRKILNRPQQPFAVMARDVEAVKRVAKLSSEEENEMLSYIRPITVLRKKDVNSFFAVAPDLDTIGIMLPYAPIHHILFRFLKADFIVLTSANMPGEPMFIDDGVFSLALDAVLRHNLVIANRVDDSVIKFVGNHRMIIRRSRGFVPKTFSLNVNINAIALGAELYNSIALLKDGKVVLSQYIGNTANFRTYNEFFKKAIDFFTSFLRMDRINAVICDAHPLYNTSRFAEKLAEDANSKLVRVQHHFAHGMSVMAERGIDRAVAIAVDGVGYGFDGTTWGGEVLLIDFENRRFERVGRLETLELLGGDLAVRFPLRVLFSAVYTEKGDYNILEPYSRYLRSGENFELFAKQIDEGLALAKASSAGRYLDACSAMLELCFERTYEGEPAMKLEACVKEGEPYYEPIISSEREEAIYPSPCITEGFEAKTSEVEVLRVKPVICDALERYLEGETKSTIAYQVIDYLACGLAEIAARAARKAKADVVMSGGVAFNSYLTPLVEKYLSEKEIRLFVNEEVAAGDNGISFGQIYISKFLEELA
ncbi:carbamoyltransferase HypF [Archaeoglobus veneficus]|uniref:Carbamoyltransferase n=1 Tax=Archaeoglobus veneficus (strain DSM 11195 / SNP6) TaxID=693661 RepID=F2KN83_ARCVS|nr:carbamoyltransferase HypF [Archaeoglobus veneficus]AEA46184.1 Acylphosphatase [Archaeoglobus veneficus SNP6]